MRARWAGVAAALHGSGVLTSLSGGRMADAPASLPDDERAPETVRETGTPSGPGEGDLRQDLSPPLTTRSFGQAGALQISSRSCQVRSAPGDRGG